MSLHPYIPGTPDDIPDELDHHCRRYTAEDVRKRIDYEDINRPALVPGVCRFCKRAFRITHSVVGEGEYRMEFPVEQCDRVSRLWPEAHKIKQRRKADYERTRTEVAGKRTRKTDEYFDR